MNSYDTCNASMLRHECTTFDETAKLAVPVDQLIV